MRSPCQTEIVMTISNPTSDMLLSALRDQLDAGIDSAVLDSPSEGGDEVGLAQILSSFTQPSSGPDGAPGDNANRPHEIAGATAPQSSETVMPASARMPAMFSPSHPDLGSVSSLGDLKQLLQDFDGCALKQTASSLVFADGNPDADIMLIGEAPGRDEDKMGLPFVGAAGQLLDKMLASIGFDRTHVYITNILPWRPPGNRTPSVEETQMMTPFLMRHIELASPRLIMALGGSSAKLLLNTTQGILKLRGQMRDVDISPSLSLPVLPSLHPAYLLRAPAMKKLAYADLLILKQMSKQLGK